MASSADVTAHLNESFGAVRETLLSWTRVAAGDGDHRTLLLNYLTEAGLGETVMLGASSFGMKMRRGSDSPGLLIVGSHDASTLSSVPHSGSVTPGQLRGPGTGSLVGPLLAFVEGLRAAVRAGVDVPPIDLLSVGPGDTLASVLAAFAPRETQAVAWTHALSWNPEAPTITTGSRGVLDIELSLAAPSAVNDDAYAGAAVNPLNEMVRLLGTLRDPRGKIALDGFYNRAQTAPRDELTPLEPTAWQHSIGAAVPSGSLSGIERATVWPTISVLELDARGGDANSTPSQARARLAFHLISDQRPVEVEQSVRTWFGDKRSPALEGILRVHRSARPYRSSLDDAAVVSQMRATKRVHRRVPSIVPAGGAPGAGEVHYATNAPVCFFGLCGPAERWGTTDETLTERQFEDGVARAAFFVEDLARS